MQNLFEVQIIEFSEGTKLHAACICEKVLLRAKAQGTGHGLQIADGFQVVLFRYLACHTNGIGVVDPDFSQHTAVVLFLNRLVDKIVEGHAVGNVRGVQPQNGGEDVNINKTVPASAVNLSVGQNGVITAVIDGGDPITVGVIAVGSVINPNGLTKLSNGYYQGGNNAGDMTVGTCTGVLGDAYLNNMPADTATSDLAIGKGGTTKIIAGGLESSKTDIAVEFADLITAQRGFQANTKIITVTDEMLSLIDVLVDGEFQLENRDISLQFRGSSNQRLICVKETLETGRIVWWSSKIERMQH